MKTRKEQIEKDLQKLWTRYDQADLPAHNYLGDRTMLKFGILEIINRLEIELEEVDTFGYNSIRRRQRREKQHRKEMNYD